jgi:hypothetical protein
MGYWWIDRVLPSITVSVPVFLAGLYVQGRRLRQHVDTVTSSQTQAIQEITDAQTTDLGGEVTPRS